ncbi:HAD hydrolase-like protein [Phenylobacterium sp.]|uniref:HAD hydrolase-like protein n=1 Tax=Phenylobacterium sp. TaxID=1871053 RepID=UPI0035AF0F46
MPIRARSTLLLDLDGTLVDPAPGILGSVRHALHSFGLEAPPAEDLRWMIGPPVRQGFAELLAGRADVEEAVRRYRARYAESGLYEAAVYPGVPQVLAAHHARGARLLICTAKHHAFARRVVEHFGLAPLLSGVYGAELDGRFEDKAELIGHLLEVERLRAEQVCMIGDRRHDVVAAAAHGIPAIGVLWGFGGRAELVAAGADLVVERPDQLLPPGA